MDIHNLLDSEDATGLAEWVRRGEVQPGELLEAVIERIERVEPQLNAVAERLYDSARQSVRASRPGPGVFAGVPTLIKDLFSPIIGPDGNSPRLGLKPNTPQQDAGTRKEPPPSLPWANGTTRAATKAAAPPLEPPALWPIFQGLRVAPKRFDSVEYEVPNSGEVLVPTITHPARRIRLTCSASKSARAPPNACEPWVIAAPLTGENRSLIKVGTPANTP